MHESLPRPRRRAQPSSASATALAVLPGAVVLGVTPESESDGRVPGTVDPPGSQRRGRRATRQAAKIDSIFTYGTSINLLLRLLLKTAVRLITVRLYFWNMYQYNYYRSVMNEVISDHTAHIMLLPRIHL